MKQPVPWRKYTASAYLAEFDIFCYASLFILYDKPENEKIWKKRLLELCEELKKMDVKNKKDATYIALVTMSHGTHFKYDINTPEDVINEIRCHLDMRGGFSHDMARAYNQYVFFMSLNYFYNEFLIPWICKTEDTPKEQEFYDAVDLYLINNRIKMV